MAAPNPQTVTPGEGDNEDLISSDTGDSSELYNDDDILNVNPDRNNILTAGGPEHRHYVKDNDRNITPGFNDEPGAVGLQRGETTMGSDLPSEQAEDDIKIDSDPRRSYVNSINIAITSLQKEIYKSEEERKQNEIIIERQFAEIIEVLCNKKFELIQKMNEFYDEQKDESMDRIQELKNELSEKELEIQIEKEKERQREEALKREEEEKAQAAAELAAKRAEEADAPMTASKRLSIFGNKLKENATKAKNMAYSKYIEWMADKNGPSVAEQAKYDKHHKVRLFVPKKELAKLIGTDIRLSTEWWDPFRMNHIVYNTHDAELWRTSAIQSGWYNAFGSIKVRKSQTKRWNIKIIQRGKKRTSNTRKKQPVDVVLGVIESSKARSQDKAAGFWSKGWDGFGLYGWNGKIFHKKSRGKVYGSPFYANQVIGIELDMMPTPGMDLESKSKARTHIKGNSSIRNVMEIGKKGAVIKFYIDDEDFGIAFYDLDLDKEYSLAVALNSDQYTLQLIE